MGYKREQESIQLLEAIIQSSRDVALPVPDSYGELRTMMFSVIPHSITESIEGFLEREK